MIKSAYIRIRGIKKACFVLNFVANSEYTLLRNKICEEIFRVGFVLLYLYNEFAIMLHDILVTQCANRALHAGIVLTLSIGGCAKSDSVASTVIFIKNVYLKESL
jgi:hypothetical protein